MPRNRSGFTLVELLVVMGIILILVSIALPAANSARNKAKDTEVKAGCNEIMAALEQYAVTHGGMYPGAHWEEDSNGNFYVGPGVIGGLPTYDGANPRKDFYVPKPGDNTGRGPNNQAAFLVDDTPNPQVIDAIVAEGYLTNYPANPFLRATDSGKAQMGNLFLFNPILGDIPPTVGRYDTLDWNRYTNIVNGDDASGANITTMRKTYSDFGRGHFTYIPLSPANNSGYDHAARWTDAPAPDYNDYHRSEYYKRCRGYILVGWGHSRMDDTQAKGVSEKYWNASLDSGSGAFDFDMNLEADGIELLLGVTGGASLVEPEVRDSGNSSGAYGGSTLAGGPDIDPSFYGATFFKITGS